MTSTSERVLARAEGVPTNAFSAVYLKQGLVSGTLELPKQGLRPDLGLYCLQAYQALEPEPCELFGELRVCDAGCLASPWISISPDLCPDLRKIQKVSRCLKKTQFSSMDIKVQKRPSMFHAASGEQIVLLPVGLSLELPFPNPKEATFSFTS